jgi:hypothetical protein
MSQDEFSTTFRKSPMKRAKLAGCSEMRWWCSATPAPLVMSTCSARASPESVFAPSEVPAALTEAAVVLEPGSSS